MPCSVRTCSDIVSADHHQVKGDPQNVIDPHPVQVRKYTQCGNLAIFHTMWKYHDFSITLILREIKFEVSRSAKSAVFTHLEARNFDLYGFFRFLKAEIYQCNKIQRPKNG